MRVLLLLEVSDPIESEHAQSGSPFLLIYIGPSDTRRRIRFGKVGFFHYY